MHVQKAQSTVEYVLLVAAVIAVVIAFTQTKFKDNISHVFETTSCAMTNVADSLAKATQAQAPKP